MWRGPLRTIATLLASASIAGMLAWGTAWAEQGEHAHQEEAEDEAHAHEGHPLAAPVTRAVAVLEPTEGNDARGTVTFTLTPEGVRVEADVQGLEPGLRGFHVHEYGDCSAPDGTSAGGHFNPAQLDHAGPDASARHVGDLGNIEVDENGQGSYDRVDPLVAFEGPHSVLGRGLIVHAEADDLVSQPTGAAGARVACGVIGVVAADSE